MGNLTIGTKTQYITIIIVRNMDISMRIALGHTLVATTKDGWVKLHVSFAWRLLTSISIVQLGQRHQAMNSTKEKERHMLKKL